MVMSMALELRSFEHLRGRDLRSHHRVDGDTLRQRIGLGKKERVARQALTRRPSVDIELTIQGCFIVGVIFFVIENI